MYGSDWWDVLKCTVVLRVLRQSFKVVLIQHFSRESKALDVVVFFRGGFGFYVLW